MKITNNSGSSYDVRVGGSWSYCSAPVSEEYTLVELCSFRVTALDSEVVLEWETGAEIDMAGFNVLRAETPEGPWVKLNEHLIPSHGSPRQGGSYSFSDETRQPGTVCWYCIEEMRIAGGTERHPPQLVWDEGLTDADGDGMPDVWEQRLGIDTGNQADANADADNDGSTNLAEYLAGTSPVNPQDCPRLRIERREGTDVPLLTWQGRVGRTYELVTADSLTELLNGSPRVLSTRSATSYGAMRFENAPGAEESRRFYRLIISPPQ